MWIQSGFSLDDERMNDTVTYEWTKKLATASLRTFYKDKIGRTGLIATGGLILFIIGVCNYYFLTESIGIALCFIGFILSILLAFEDLLE